MQSISTISEFFIEAGTDYRVIDMGRGFATLDSQVFLDIETNKIAVPFPRQQKLWLGLVFWNKQLSGQHFIWFISLPLDEQSKLVTANRDHFLNTIVEALGTEMLQQGETSLKDNPYCFRPSEQQMSDVNSYIRNELELPPSQHYQLAKNFIARPDLNDWRQVPLQGLSDIASCLSRDSNGKHIEANFRRYPEVVRAKLCAALENYVLPASLQTFLLQSLGDQAFSTADLCAILRALNKAEDKAALKDKIVQILQNPEALNLDLLTVIAGRHWDLCQDYGFTVTYLNKCAEAGVFGGIFPDLVQIPSVRNTVLQTLRDPERPAGLSKAIQLLFAGGRGE